MVFLYKNTNFENHEFSDSSGTTLIHNQSFGSIIKVTFCSTCWATVIGPVPKHPGGMLPPIPPALEVLEEIEEIEEIEVEDS